MKTPIVLTLPCREACPNLTFTAGINAALELLPAATRRKVMTAAFDYIFKGVLPTKLNRQMLALFCLILETSAFAQTSGAVPYEKVELPGEQPELPATTTDTSTTIETTQDPEPDTPEVPTPKVTAPPVPVVSPVPPIHLPRKLKKLRLRQVAKRR